MKPPTAYFIGTNGKITVWRPFRRDRVYRSVMIKEFTRSWRRSRPSGPNSHHVVRIQAVLFEEIRAAQEAAGNPHDAWIENGRLPQAVLAALAAPVLAPPDPSHLDIAP